jgi:hypothetical protein
MQKEKNKELMCSFLDRVKTECIPAVLQCAPENSGYVHLYQSQDILTKDSVHWTPEVPEQIGLYHAMVRGYDREVREHKLFLICSGGVAKACDEFCNLVIDIGDSCDAYTTAISEESWWLKRACYRSRCSLLYDLAQTFGVSVQSIEDIQAKRPRNLAVHAIDTVEYDMVFQERTGQVHIFNGCADTNLTHNGVMVKMHPAEGYWLFRCGDKNRILNQIGVFPTFQPEINKKDFCVKVMHGSNKVVDVSFGGRQEECDTPSFKNYMCFDERYMSVLQSMSWDRNQGIVELIPIVVGVLSEKK